MHALCYFLINSSKVKKWLLTSWHNVERSNMVSHIWRRENENFTVASTSSTKSIHTKYIPRYKKNNLYKQIIKCFWSQFTVSSISLANTDWSPFVCTSSKQLAILFKMNWATAYWIKAVCAIWLKVIVWFAGILWSTEYS